MKKVLLFTSLFFLIILSAYVITNPSVRNVITGQEVVEFEGTLTQFSSGAIADAPRTAVVNGYTIITSPGFGTPVITGKSDIGTNDVGKVVKVRAKRIDGKSLTLIGDTSYYIKLAE